MIASGEFEVQFSPQTEDEIDAGRTLINKTYRGGLEGSGQGQMLSKHTAIKGSAAYVAIEEFSGNLEGQKGAFTLQHTGTMNRDAPSLTVIVVPDSGTEELTGISGVMRIEVADGKHSYEFEYTISQDQ